ncbi:MAG: class 1 isoprenoid biosynthesis enzyme [Prolixibacteraceae bacterium]|nr:class 1 isoprenoid biosynthesis enzyme [Prolixibacteraceae bacterium]
MNIQQLVNNQVKIWNKISGDFPCLGAVIPTEEKTVRERALEKFALSANPGNRSDTGDVLDNEAYKRQLMEKLGVLFRTSFNYTDSELSIITRKGFMPVTTDFMKMARDFDPDISIEDIFQACRNLWIVNSLQVMMGQPVVLTPSVFAYSMLYPYSDNYLDDPHVSAQEKVAFSNRFRKRLTGEKVLAANPAEKLVFDLVALIESDWDRTAYPLVYQSLLSIHDAQTKSIRLMDSAALPGEDELLSICIEKGGTSVLADGYLVKGSLSPAQEEFCFGFGVVLQYIDDIQDISEDMSGGLETAFTRAHKEAMLEHYTNKTLNATATVLADLSCFDTDDPKPMMGLMNKSIRILAIEAIGKNSEYWDKHYLDEFEKYSPFSYAFVKKRRSNMQSNRISFMRKIEQHVFAGEAEKSAIV